MTTVMGSDWRGVATELDRSLLSVIAPIYNEEDTLPELERRLPTAVAGLGFRVLEFLLISDGSIDRSEAIIRQIVARDGRFRGIFLTRNFGHQAAVSTGLAHGAGRSSPSSTATFRTRPRRSPHWSRPWQAGPTSPMVSAASVRRTR